MGSTRKTQLLATAGLFGLLTVAFAQQPNNDPYNPHNQRGANAVGNRMGNVSPSLMDMGFGTDQGNAGPFVTMADKQFAQMTALRAMMEIELGKAAVEKGDSVDVRNLGQRMADDYTKWSNGIHRASARLNIPLPEGLDAKRKARVGRVKALSGPEFDQAYLKEMVHLQNKALTITQYEATNAGVTMFRNWAGKMMPTIQEQLRVAKQCLNPTVVSRK